MYLFWSRILLEQGSCQESLNKINLAMTHLKEKDVGIFMDMLFSKGQIYKNLATTISLLSFLIWP